MSKNEVQLLFYDPLQLFDGEMVCWLSIVISLILANCIVVCTAIGGKPTFLPL